jgi:hypothetical protein
MRRTAPSQTGVGPGSISPLGKCLLPVRNGQILDRTPLQAAAEPSVAAATLVMPKPAFRWARGTPMKTEFPDAGTLFMAGQLPAFRVAIGYAGA